MIVIRGDRYGVERRNRLRCALNWGWPDEILFENGKFIVTRDDESWESTYAAERIGSDGRHLCMTPEAFENFKRGQLPSKMFNKYTAYSEVMLKFYVRMEMSFHTYLKCQVLPLPEELVRIVYTQLNGSRVG